MLLPLGAEPKPRDVVRCAVAVCPELLGATEPRKDGDGGKGGVSLPGSPVVPGAGAGAGAGVVPSGTASAPVVRTRRLVVGRKKAKRVAPDPQTSTVENQTRRISRTPLGAIPLKPDKKKINKKRKTPLHRPSTGEPPKQ